MPMPMMRKPNPQREAIDRGMNATQGAPAMPPQGAKPAPQQPGAQQGQAPVEVAIKILDMTAKRLGEINPAAGSKLTAAVGQLKTTIEEVKKEMSASGGQPAGQPAGGPGSNQPGGRPMPPQPMPA